MRVVLRRQLLTVGTEVNTLAFDSPMIETGGIQRHWSHKSHDFRRPFSKKSTKPTEGAPGRRLVTRERWSAGARAEIDH